jgi:hypothetical protein
MQYLRFSVACLSALACLGASYPDSVPPLPPRGPGSLGTRLSVELCLGASYSSENCGPQGTSGSVPYPTSRAGIVSAPSMEIRCPLKCAGMKAGAVTLKVKAIASQSSGRHRFAHWDEEGGCKGQGKTCKLSISKNRRARVVAYFSSY